MSNIPAERVPAARTALALSGLSASVLLASLGTSSANVALPRLADAFFASFHAVQWVVLSYLIAVTAVVVAVGKLGDVFGRRRLLLAGIVIFTAASGIAGVAPNLGTLIAARAAQGIGAAAMLALTMTFVADVVPGGRPGSAMGMLGTMSAAGTALGPSLGGLLIASLDWHAVFLINVPLGMLASLLIWSALPADTLRSKEVRSGIDIGGIVLFGASVALYALAASTWGRIAASEGLVMITAAAVLLVLFIVVELRAKSPLIDLRLFRDVTLSTGFVTSATVSAVMMSTMIVGPFYLSIGLGMSAAQVGAAMSVGPLVAAVAGVPSGRAVDRFGSRSMISTGLGVIALGAAVLSQVSPEWGALGYVVPLAVVTAGYALFQSANNSSVMAAAISGPRGVVGGMLSLSRYLGLVTGAAVLGSVFSAALGVTNIGTADVGAIGWGTRVTFAAASCLAAASLGVSLLRKKHSAELSPRHLPDGT